jgi:hypothetical protein
MAKCLARLTKWNKTTSRLAPCMTAARVVLCKNVPKNADSNLCDECLARPLDGKYHDRILHGLLTEPIPEISRIYGGPWYWDQIDKHFPDGEPDDKQWLASALESQRLAEEFCGPGAWKVQRPNARVIQMRKCMASAKRANAKTKVIVVNSKEKEKEKEKVAGTVLASFSPIKVIYEERIEEPVKLATDSMKIRKETYGDISVWITEDGMVFDCDTTGEPAELIARYVDGDFVDF